MLSISPYYEEKEDLAGLDEGFMRGIGSEFQDFVDDFGAIADLFHLGREDIMPRIKKVTGKLKNFVRSRNFSIHPGGDSSLLKFRQGWARWRFFFFLNDKLYKNSLDYIKKTGRDPVGYLNFNFSDRVLPKIYKAKNSNDLIKVIDEYEDRVENVYKLAKANPNVSGYGPYLRQGMYGLRDLVVAIRRLVAYNS
jgi:hypothetical protein